MEISEEEGGGGGAPGGAGGWRTGYYGPVYSAMYGTVYGVCTAVYTAHRSTYGLKKHPTDKNTRKNEFSITKKTSLTHGFKSPPMATQRLRPLKPASKHQPKRRR
jgi:hypothetical protein